MLQSTAGSYAFGSFQSNESELRRLKRQAEIARDLEHRMWRRVGLAQGMNVLDLACGPGVTTLELARVVNPGHVLGVDVSEALLDEAREELRRTPMSNVSFQQGDVYALDLGDQRFDFAYARLLFQHLEAPVEVAENVLRVLEPGGMFCVVDVDDEWLTLHPRPSSFKAFTRWAAAGQRQRGGDRNVGRKLGTYLHRAGFTEVHTFVEVLTSHDIGLETFLDITTGFKHEQVSGEYREFARNALEEIYSVLDEPHAWGAVGVFVATGKKP